MCHNKVSSPGNRVHVAKYKHISSSPEVKEVTHRLCAQLVPRGSGILLPQTFAVTSNTSKSSSHPCFVFSPVPTRCRTVRDQRSKRGLMDSAQKKGCVDNPDARCLAPYKGTPARTRRAVTRPFPSPFLSDRACQPKLGKLHCFLKAPVYNLIYCNKSKYPALKMIMVQEGFPEFFRLPSNCHMFPGRGRACSRGKQGTHYEALPAAR